MSASGSPLCFALLAAEVENYDENLHDNPVDQSGTQKRYYFENLKISVPQIKLSVFTSSKLPLDLRVSGAFALTAIGFPQCVLGPQVADIQVAVATPVLSRRVAAHCDGFVHLAEQPVIIHMFLSYTGTEKHAGFSFSQI